MSAYFAPLVLLPVVIDGAGQYRTRAGEVVAVYAASTGHNFGCCGTYPGGTAERWHKSGRLYAARECANDIIEKVML